MKISNIKDLTIEFEGRRNKTYYDSLGFVTGGVGHLLDPRKGGYLPDPAVDFLLDWDLDVARKNAARIPGYLALNPVRQDVVTEMVFQLGFEPFDGDGFKDFKDFLAAIKAGDPSNAASAMLDSVWARTQTPRRARILADMMKAGVYL